MLNSFARELGMRRALCSLAMNETQPELQLVDNVWVVRIEQPNGKVQTYRCATEAQAKQMAMVLKPPALS